MTYSSDDSPAAAKPARSRPADRPSPRLDGPDALLTAEWNIEDLPWITSDDGLMTLEHDSVRQPSPPPPSRRLARKTVHGAVAARPGAAGPLGPALTVPKKPRPQLPHSPAVLVAPDLGATLPPKAERHQLPSELPSVERDGEPSPEGWLVRFRKRHWPLASLGTLLCVTTAYAVSSALITADDDGAPLERTPEFLRDRGASARSAPPDAGDPPSLPGAMPPNLAATFAHASRDVSDAAATPAPDAGVSQGPWERRAEPAEPYGASVSAQVHSRPPSERERAPSEAAEPSLERTPGMAHAARRSGSARSLAVLGKRPGKPPSSPSVGREEDPGSPKSDAPSSTSAASRAIRPLTTYTYADKALFSVATAPMRVTDLVLEPGEKLVSRPTAGDAARWVITVLDSVTRGEPQTHVFVKPLRSGLRTNLTLTTDRRSYFLELSSTEDGKYMAGVQWQYPLDAAERRRQKLTQAARERLSTTAVSNLEALRFDYRVQVTAGDPSWMPTMVFDDGEKTFIRFPGPVTPARAPVLFVLRTGNIKDATFINYRVKSDLYVLERLIDVAELRLDGDEGLQDVVRITRR